MLDSDPDPQLWSKSGLNVTFLPMQLTDRLLVVMSLLLIGLTQISWGKTSFDHPFVMESLLWLKPDKKLPGGSLVRYVNKAFLI
jgi:hypothetical protein